LGIKGAQDIESAYLRGLGQSQTELTKFANTRQFGPSQDVYGYSVRGGLESALGGGSDLLSRALGMFMGSKALGGADMSGMFGFGGGGSASGSNLYGMSATRNPYYY